MIATIHQKLIEAGLNDAGQMNESNAGKVASLLALMATQGAAADASAAAAARAATASGTVAAEDGAPGAAGARDGTDAVGSTAPVFSLRFAPQIPLVAVGAPAPTYYPAVARGLGMVLALPRFAEVANAVGAVLGRVSQRVHVTVTQPVRGVFRVFAAAGPRDFDTLAPAIAHAQQLAGADALVQALDAGAAHAEVVLSQRDNRVDNDIDGAMFFESRVTATASGPPLRRAEPARRTDTHDAGLAHSA